MLTLGVGQLGVYLPIFPGYESRPSSSRSQISRIATDCTLPAESPLRTLRHNRGLIW